MFLNPNNFFQFELYCSNLLVMRNLQEQVKKAFCYQKLFWPFTAWMNCSIDLKNFANFWPSASNFKSFSRSVEQFFLTVGQNNFRNKILFFPKGHFEFLMVELYFWMGLQVLKPKLWRSGDKLRDTMYLVLLL